MRNIKNYIYAVLELNGKKVYSSVFDGSEMSTFTVVIAKYGRGIDSRYNPIDIGPHYGYKVEKISKKKYRIHYVTVPTMREMAWGEAGPRYYKGYNEIEIRR